MMFLTETFGKPDTKQILSIFFGSALVFFVPYLHLGVLNSRVFTAPKPEVDVLNCANTCWDTKFKGNYETIPAGYKHVYFNINSSTLKIWFATVVCLLAFYETTKRIAGLLLRGKLRYSMLALFCSVVYSHYYTWWSVFNYLNDDFYDEWYHQLFFSGTELISTICVVHLFNQDNYLQPRLLLVILDVALFHILLSTRDQFLTNVFQQNGEVYQIIRDLGFMIPDILHVVIPSVWLWHWKQNKHRFVGAIPKVYSDESKSSIYTITQTDFVVSIAAVITLAVVGSFL